jgi:mono/diheme cytochrome c family protein
VGLAFSRASSISLILLTIFGVGCAYLTFPSEVPASALPPYTANLVNGRVMFYAGGCAGCHAVPGQEDKTKLGGGLALKSPFGTFYVPNISPDPNDGIGRWSEADFVTALWKGTSPQRRHYYPALPYTSYQRMTLDDVRDLFAYIKTLTPVAGRAPPHDVSFPFNMRRAIGFWKLLFLDGQRFQPDPTKSAQWNRGAYLVNGPGHCAECHSPRNFVGAIIASQRFAGGPSLDRKGWVPNITEKGLADWSVNDIAYMLETGMTPDGDSVGGGMTEVVRNISQLPADDRMAIAVYLKSLPPVEGPPKPPKKDQVSATAPASLLATNSMSVHDVTNGLPRWWPPWSQQ